MLKIINYSKAYRKDQYAVKNLNLEVEAGDLFAFIGHNGAGKSTTIKSIVGILPFEEGEIYIDGLSVKDYPVECKKKIAYIPDNPDLYESLTGMQYLNFIGDVFKIKEAQRKKIVEQYAKEFELYQDLNNLISSYSHGMKQKLAIISAFIHSPKLLILDEPTNGLDPEGIKEIRELLKDLAEKEEMAVLISSHNLLELETFCNKICIIKNGKVMETNKIEDVKNIAKSGYIFEIDNTEMIDKMFKNVTIVNRNMFKIAVDRDEVPSVIKKLVENDIKIYAVNENKISLEDAFLKKTGGNVID